jgi:magnesium transporter
MTAGATQPSLTWRPVGGPGVGDDLDEHNSAVVKEFSRLIKEGDRKAVTRALKRWPPAHLIGLFVHLPLKRARVLMNWLDRHQARVVSELNPSFRDALLEDVTVQRLTEVLDALEPPSARRPTRRRSPSSRTVTS